MRWFHKKKKEKNEYEELLQYFPEEEEKEIAKRLQEEEEEQMQVETSMQRKQFVENCCLKIKDASDQIEDSKMEYQIVNSYLSDIHIIENMPDDQKEKLIALVKKVIVLEREKEEFKEAIENMPEKQYAKLYAMEADMGKILKSLSEDEKYCATVKRDMSLLEGEKSTLKIEKKELEEKRRVLAALSKISIITFVAIFLLFFACKFFFHKNIDIFIFIALFVAAVVVGAVFMLDHHVLYQIRLGEAKLNKLIGLLNRAKLKYVNVVSRLEYQYEKYQIRNAYELNRMFGEYSAVKKKREISRNASEQIYEAKDEISALLSMQRLYDAQVWLEQLSAFVDKREMEEIKSDLNTRRTKLKESMDYNLEIIDNAEKQVKDLIQKKPEYAKEVLDIVEKYS